MDQSYSDSDISVSPTKIFERLQMLRQLQIMQRGKLQKHRLQYQDSPEVSSSVTEIVSHFSNSTSYNTFRSLLQSSHEIHNDQHSFVDNDEKHVDHDYIDGISVLNLSQESEFITNTPLSSRSRTSAHSKSSNLQEKTENIPSLGHNNLQPIVKNQISLDEMPILSPKTDFEQLVIEKLQNEKIVKNKSPKNVEQVSIKTKTPFLRRGEGMARFGLKKNDLVIQNTKALPWRKSNLLKKTLKKNVVHRPVENEANNKSDHVIAQKTISPQVDLVEPKSKLEVGNVHPTKEIICGQKNGFHQSVTLNISEASGKKLQNINTKRSNNTELTSNVKSSEKETHPLKTAKGQTWASVLTKEQDNFLRQLKQSDYYKNFVSPVKSTISESSCNDTLIKLRHDREVAEQNMFELLENKVTHESFILDNSFINRFLKKSTLECSGESTPLVLQRCLYDNPELLHLHSESTEKKRNSNSCSDAESCSEYTECSETCSSVSACCSCKKSEPSGNINLIQNRNNDIEKGVSDQRPQEFQKKKIIANDNCLADNAKMNGAANAEMAEMNAKLIATSELLKDRLKELEDEIETFRKENANLTKMREDLDLERQKFYEDKTTFEQKYNEEKILSEYYIAEEKEKLSKQKQLYDRYVREMRGRLSKKDKDEVISLKKEITELKEEIRNKDAKTTSTIARLRNQIKIMEREKKTLQDEVDKLQKENRRIQHSNDITRRLTNLKYLEQINKKLAHVSSKDVSSEADLRSDMKYKAFEIERQSRCKKIKSAPNTRRRAKSVPNLNVTSRYAKYFSQKDAISDKDINKTNFKHLDIDIASDNEDVNCEKESVSEDFNNSNVIDENSEEDNNLEKIYNERFQSFSQQRNIVSHETETNKKYSPRQEAISNSNDGFFIQKSHSVRSSKSLSKSSLSPCQASSSESSTNTSKSPASILSHRSYRSSYSPVNIARNSVDHDTNNLKSNPYVNNRPKSPISILSNKSSACQISGTCLKNDIYSDKRMIPSPEPSSSRTNVSKTNLNPTEIRKPDGSRELRFPNGNVKHISADGKYTKFIYYNGDVKENFYDEGTIKYFYAETKTYHTTHADGLEVLEFSDGQVEKRYKDGSSEIRLPNGSVRYFDPKNEHVREEWRFPDGAALTVSANGEQRIVFSNGQVEVHAKDHKRREFPDGTVKLVYNDGTSETRYASGRVRIKDKHGNLIMDSAPG